MKRVILTFVFGLFFSTAAAAFAGQQDFTLVNSSSSSICYVYISASNTSDWEEDILGADECLEPGQSIKVTFSGSSHAVWDLRVEDENGSYEDYRGFNLNQISRIRILGGGQAEYQ